MQTQDIKIKIRVINPLDYESILRLSRLVIKEAYSEEEFNEDKIKEVFYKALNDKNFMCIVIEINGVIRGFAFLSFSELFFINKSFCLCLAIYVEKGFRKYGSTLIKSIELVAKERRLQGISIHTMSGLSPKTMGNLLNKFDFKEREVGYWKELKNG